MDLAAVALVLAAAGLHAAWNVRLHGADDRVAAMATSGLLAGAALVPFVIAEPPPSSLWVLVAISGVAQAAYGLALAGAYRRGELAVTYPVGRGSAPLMATVAAVAVVGQPVTPRTLVASALVAVGLILLALRSHRRGTLAATALALVVGATIATYSVLDARAVIEGAAPLAYLGVTLGLGGALTAAATGFDRGRLRGALRPGVAIAIGGVGAYALVLFAFRLAPVGRVATLREISVVIAVLLAHERPGAIGWLGIGAVVAGAALAAF